MHFFGCLLNKITVSPSQTILATKYAVNQTPGKRTPMTDTDVSTHSESGVCLEVRPACYATIVTTSGTTGTIVIVSEPKRQSNRSTWCYCVVDVCHEVCFGLERCPHTNAYYCNSLGPYHYVQLRAHCRTQHLHSTSANYGSKGRPIPLAVTCGCLPDARCFSLSSPWPTRMTRLQQQ